MTRTFFTAAAALALFSVALSAQAQQAPIFPMAQPVAPLPPPAEAQPASEARGKTIAIVGGRIITNTGAPIEGGTVVIKDGRILSVGPGPAPAGAAIVDAKGKWVTPPLLAGFSRLGIQEVELEDDANDAPVREVNVAVAADAAEAFDPRSVGIPVTRREGVGRAAVNPIGGPSPFAGFGALADLSGSPASLTRAKAFLMVEATDEGVERAGHSRMTFWRYLDAAFSDAGAYPARFISHPDGTVLGRAEAEALVPVLRGEIPIALRVHRAADIRQALAFKARRPQVKLILLGAAEGWMAAKEIAAAGVPVFVDPSQDLPARFDRLYSRLDNASLLRAAGVKVAIAPVAENGSGHEARQLAQMAGNAAAHGLGWAEAFRAVTATPADILGLKGVGRLAPGAIGDVAIWDGDPLEVMTTAEAMWIAGAPVSLASRQTALRDRYLAVHSGAEKPYGYR